MGPSNMSNPIELEFTQLEQCGHIKVLHNLAREMKYDILTAAKLPILFCIDKFVVFF